jgi:lipopolysaccharide transport system ATP-binding protein
VPRLAAGIGPERLYPGTQPMSGDIVIRAEGLGKKYTIGHVAERETYTTLRDVIGRRATLLLRGATDLLHGRAMIAGDRTEEIWALRDVDFEIRRGEVVGIIGRNGAGKSTLLKILSRITEPTAGQVEIHGRVASLIEVGTGFHSELTGCENIYLNGAILGMSRAEIKRKFEEIVDFSGVEKFIDTPVKRYSSGMQVRLAFAVAAHLEPEILLADEVLAVGDAEFQKKCLGKMSEVAGSGRTVLFVSHQLGSIGQLCRNAILLRDGRIAAAGPSAAIIAEYVAGVSTIDAKPIVAKRRQPASLTAVVTQDVGGKVRNTFNSNEKFQISLKFNVRDAQEAFRVGLRINSPEKGAVLTSTEADSSAIKHWEPGEHHLVCNIPANFLSPGEYYICAAADIPMNSILFNEIDIASFSITPLGAVGANIPDNRGGIVRPLLEWHEVQAADALRV